MRSSVLAVVGWPDVAIALIAGLPGIIAAVAALLVRHEVRTSNGYTLAQTVEDTQKNASDTHAIVRRTMGERKTDVPQPHKVPTGHMRAEDD
jgi:hypothetical protein